MSDLLHVEGLRVSFERYAAGLRRRTLDIITDLSLDVAHGEVVAVVGSSGSGKSLLAHAVLGILPGNARASGTIRFEGDDLTAERQAELRGTRIAFVPQTVSHLDPLMRVGAQVRTGVRDGDPVAAQRAVFARYGLAEEAERLYPFQLSGGMARRALVATAVLSGASLIIADEPTPGLHPQAAREALGHLRELADQGLGVVLITHDIETALEIADRVAVFYAGSTVETCEAADFSGNGATLRHPYTRALWQALPQNGFSPIKGGQPPYDDLPQGCLFEPRCERSTHVCAAARPEPRILRGGMVRCVHAT